MPALPRRRLLIGAAGLTGLAGAGLTTAWATGQLDRAPRLLDPHDPLVGQVEARRHHSGTTIHAALIPRPVTLDLGGPVVQTWGYTDTAPGPLLRAHAGDLLQVEVTNRLPVSTSVHWHGIALRNDMDGVPGVTQPPIAPGAAFTYAFVAADPGTYFYHPHSGVQLDRALHGVLIVDDPADPGDYDAEWIVVLDDWVDGTGRTPDDVLASLHSMAGMGGMDMGMGMGMGGNGNGNGYGVDDVAAARRCR